MRNGVNCGASGQGPAGRCAHAMPGRVMCLSLSLSLSGMLEALVDSAADREESVRESIFKSVVDVGRKKHTQVLDVLHSYLSKHSKVGVASEGASGGAGVGEL